MIIGILVTVCYCYTGATVRLLPIADVVEGQSADVCVIVESQSAQTVGFEMSVTLAVTSGTASMFKNII